MMQVTIAIHGQQCLTMMPSQPFKEKGIFDKTTAESFRKNILAPMGITDAEQSFISFRGRKPDIEPLLKNRGLMN